MKSYKAIPQKISFKVAISIVIANMIGTGVFTSLGFQLEGISSIFSILLLWFLGGIIAICGALTYAELGSTLPRSGGEYHFLNDLLHPALGFLGGWVSITVGFSAPTALASITMGKYLAQVFPEYINPTYIAASLVVLLTFIHAYSKKTGGYFQLYFTIIKIVLIVLFIGFALTISNPQSISILPKYEDWQTIFTPAFAVSLIYVSYAYTGWNAASYIIGEITNPQKNFLKILFFGTLIVMILYIMLNYAFLYTASITDLKGQLEIGYISGTKVFGVFGGKIMALLLSILLISTTSAMVFAGPRVNQVMGEDMKALRFLAVITKNGVPRNAIFFQGILTLVFIFSATFEKVLVYSGLSLSIITVLTVGSLFILRRRIKKENIKQSYKLWAYPIPPIIFLTLNIYIIIFLFIEKTQESILSLSTMLLGLLIFWLYNQKKYN